MNKIELISDSDFIVSLGTFFEEEALRNSIENAIKNNNAKFVYMHPIDNLKLKSFYSQLIKYEVGSEEGICSLLLSTFTKNQDDETKRFIEDLDLGYICAESSAGEEEFEEAFESSLDSSNKVLIIGNDLENHERIGNIVKLICLIKKYSDFNVVILNENLEKKVDSCSNFDLEEIEELKSFNGTLIYKLINENSEDLIASQTFANVAKVMDKDEVYVISKNEKLKKILKIDENLHGTIAILNTKVDDIFNGYKYKQVKIEKVEA